MFISCILRPSLLTQKTMGAPNEISVSSETEALPPTLTGALTTDEKITQVTRTESHALGKATLQIDDEAGILAVRALESGPADAEISNKVLRKIDFYILPFLCITYGKDTHSNG
jgi:hypothetical protein